VGRGACHLARRLWGGWCTAWDQGRGERASWCPRDRQAIGWRRRLPGDSRRSVGDGRWRVGWRAPAQGHRSCRGLLSPSDRCPRGTLRPCAKMGRNVSRGTKPRGRGPRRGGVSSPGRPRSRGWRGGTARGPRQAARCAPRAARRRPQPKGPWAWCGPRGRACPYGAGPRKPPSKALSRSKRRHSPGSRGREGGPCRRWRPWAAPLQRGWRRSGASRRPPGLRRRGRGPRLNVSGRVGLTSTTAARSQPPRSPVAGWRRPGPGAIRRRPSPSCG